MARRRPYGTGNIQKRGERSYRVRVYSGVDSDTGKPRRREETVRGTKQDAERRLRALLSEIDHGLDVPPERLTVGEWLPRWLEDHATRSGLADRTRLRYEHIISKKLVPALGKVRLQALRADHIESMYTDQRKTLAANTIRQHHVVLKKALDQAVRGKLIPRNPIDAVIAPRAPRHQEERALTVAEIGLLLAAAEGTAWDTPIRVALATGLREGELLALRWDDIDFTAKTVTVSRAVGYLPGKGMTFSSPKTKNARRRIELSDTSIEILRAHRQSQLERRLRLGPAWQDFDLVFPSNLGTPWIVHNFYRGYRKLVSQSGITSPETVDFHCLRHTAATQWLRSGADIHSVSRRLGHASAAFSMDKYAHLLHGMQQTAAEALDDVLAL